MMTKKIYFYCTISLFFFHISSVGAQPIFEEVANSGLDAFSANEGIAIGDFNNDGWEDIYVSSPFGTNRLCKNMGDGTFQEVGSTAGVALSSLSVASTWGDINNDGFLDLYISLVNDNDQLFLNNGDETFQDITLSSGIANNANTKCVNMADVNNDGFLDIYLSNFNTENILFINNGDNSFSNQTTVSGAMDTGPSMGNIFFDYDKDGDVDLYLTHDQLVPNILYQNDGTGVFTDVSEAAGVNAIGYGMGVDVGDMDNDGWLDLYITNLFQNVLFRNNSDGTFENISSDAGVDDNGMGWGNLFLDFNKDGLMDIYVANESDFMNPNDPNVLYKNMGDLTFEKVETNQAISNIDNSYGVAAFDYNLDGNLDLAVANRDTDEHLQLFQNTGHDGNWLGVKLLGVESTRNGIGSRVEIVDNTGRIHYKEITAGHGWASQNSHILYFGLGEADALSTATIFWTSGLVQEISFEQLNKTYTIQEGSQAEEGILFGTTTSISNTNTSENFSVDIFPNPSTHFFHLQMNGKEKESVKIEVFNSMGQLIYEQKEEAVPAGKQIITISENDFFQKKNSSILWVKVYTKNNHWAQRIILH